MFFSSLLNKKDEILGAVNHQGSVVQGFCEAAKRSEVKVTPMGSTAVEKTEEDLRKEIDELLRQQREVPSLSLYEFSTRACSNSIHVIRDFVDNGEASRSSRPSQRCLVSSFSPR
jgi:hypothetical protein